MWMIKSYPYWKGKEKLKEEQFLDEYKKKNIASNYIIGLMDIYMFDTIFMSEICSIHFNLLKIATCAL